MARDARHLLDLGPDLLASILGKLPDTSSRLAAAAASKALWEASCLPGAWKDARLALDLNKSKKTSSALSFLTRQGKGLLRVELSLKPGTCSLARTQERLAPLLARLPALQELELHSQHLAVLSVVAASLPQLQQLAISPADPQAALLLPDDSASLQRLSCLQRLVVSLDVKLLSAGLDPLLRGIENLVSLTGLLLKYADESSYGAVSAPEGEWSSQLTKLQRLQLYHDELGLDPPLEVASLPELRSVVVRVHDWQNSAGIVCVLRGLTSLTTVYDSTLYKYYRAGPDSARDLDDLEETLSTLQELCWELPADGLWYRGDLELQCLTSLTVASFEDFFDCLLWSPACRLQRLVLDELEARQMFDLTALSPLTCLTFLSVSFSRVLWADELTLPRTPCLAKLQVLKLGNAGLTCVPYELRWAARLQVLELSDPCLRITDDCVADLTGLRELVRFEVYNDCRGWGAESRRNLRQLRRARPDMRVDM